MWGVSGTCALRTSRALKFLVKKTTVTIAKKTDRNHARMYIYIYTHTNVTNYICIYMYTDIYAYSYVTAYVYMYRCINQTLSVSVCAYGTFRKPSASAL